MKRAISLSFAVFLISASLKISAQEVAQTNIKPINNSVSVVTQLQPVSFNYDKQWADKLKISDKSQFGFVTADVQKVLPALVTKTAKDYSSGKNSFRSATVSKVDYESLIPLLVGSIKEQQEQIEQLKKEINVLKSRNTR
ncbi:hypothetical protein GCM10022246_39800 [Pedobacter ginsengiterrae]|uniref:Peptidase S74 domain-containing protein n=1 Tax=Pedobacter ginsengiterrae TaxID=871696 RepID=A0ABP7QKE4_9SPHI|nr:tail fiber domain-containing protein [Pedobacter aquatilis]